MYALNKHKAFLQKCKLKCHENVTLILYNGKCKGMEGNVRGERIVKDYKQLAVRYLKHNKKRTLLTILGVALSTMILFAFLNAMLSLYFTKRDELRETVKYEAILLCKEESIKEQIIEEPFVVETKETTIELSPDEGGGHVAALYTRFDRPYQTGRYLRQLEEKYGITYVLTELAIYYFAEDGLGVFGIIGLTVLLVTYIFAIFSVSVVRNSIQLISLEQIRDYGVLRCVGSTKKQLKSVVFWMGFLLELNGIILGSAFGFLLYLPLAIKAKLDIGFHVIVLPVILAVFMFDLYFVMQENCRFVNRLTPVAAVRGEFKINKSKIKARRKGLAGWLLGVEGDYAMKNLKRNPARMWKTIGIMSMGIMMVTMAMSIYLTICNCVFGDVKQYGWYQISDYVIWQPGLGAFEVAENSLLDSNSINVLQNDECVTEYKPLYETNIFFANVLELYEHMTPEYATDTSYGNGVLGMQKSYREGSAEGIGKEMLDLFLAGHSLVGYDTADYERLEEALVAGSLNLSENGIVLINGTSVLNDSTGTLNEVWEDFTITTYQIGDTIEMVDYKFLSRLIEQKLLQEGLMPSVKNGTCSWENARRVLHECYWEAVETGKTKEYVVEALIEKDVNRATMYSQEPIFVLPLNRYFNETGLNASNRSGMMYHIDGIWLSKEVEEIFYKRNSFADLSYLMVLSTLSDTMNLIIGATLFVLFLFVVNMLNVVNTTASDLYLRRREFAQLRVLGMSKKKLTFTVMLESIIVAVISGVIGVVGAYAAMKVAVDFINIGFYAPLQFSWGACMGMVALCTLLICMTVYLPIKKMKMNMAEELLASGE